jgi:galactose-1-phosphate uridylyltransferase
MIGQCFFQFFLFKKKNKSPRKKKDLQWSTIIEQTQQKIQLNQLKMIVYGDYGEVFVEVL